MGEHSLVGLSFVGSPILSLFCFSVLYFFAVALGIASSPVLVDAR